MATLIFYVEYKKARVGAAPSVAPTIAIYRVNRSTDVESVAVAPGTGMTASALTGIYRYRLLSADLGTYDYIARATTSDTTVDDREPPVIWLRWDEDRADAGYSGARATKLDFLDISVASRMATFAYTAAPSAASVASAVWASGTRTLTAFGYAVTVAGYATNQSPAELVDLTGITTALGTIETNVDSILGNTGDAATALATIDGKVDEILDDTGTVATEHAGHAGHYYGPLRARDDGPSQRGGRWPVDADGDPGLGVRRSDADLRRRGRRRSDGGGKRDAVARRRSDPGRADGPRGPGGHRGRGRRQAGRVDPRRHHHLRGRGPRDAGDRRHGHGDDPDRLAGAGLS